jgi:hypothetical protein
MGRTVKGTARWKSRSGEFTSPNGGVKPPRHQIKTLRFSMKYQKQKGLAVKSKNLAKIYIIEIKTVRSFLW